VWLDAANRGYRARLRDTNDSTGNRAQSFRLEPDHTLRPFARARLLGARTRGSSSERFKTGVTGARSEITRADGGAAAVMGSHPTSTPQCAVCAQSDFAAQAGSLDFARTRFESARRDRRVSPARREGSDSELHETEVQHLWFLDESAQDRREKHRLQCLGWPSITFQKTGEPHTFPSAGHGERGKRDEREFGFRRPSALRRRIAYRRELRSHPFRRRPQGCGGRNSRIARMFRSGLVRSHSRDELV